MPTQTLEMTARVVTLTLREQAYLKELLEADLADTRVAVRRTRTPALHDELHRREDLIRDLLKRLGEDGPSNGCGPGL